jgi:hypothetical protein
VLLEADCGRRKDTGGDSAYGEGFPDDEWDLGRDWDLHERKSTFGLV